MSANGNGNRPSARELFHISVHGERVVMDTAALRTIVERQRADAALIEELRSRIEYRTGLLQSALLELAGHAEAKDRQWFARQWLLGQRDERRW